MFPHFNIQNVEFVCHVLFRLFFAVCSSEKYAHQNRAEQYGGHIGCDGGGEGMTDVFHAYAAVVKGDGEEGGFA